MYDFGETLKKARNAKGWNQDQLAKKLDVTVSTISRYEGNLSYPPLESLRALSKILNISLDELCGLQPKGTLSLHGMTDEQIEIIKTLTEAFRNYNNTVRKTISTEQFELLGRIVTEFTK